MTSPIDLKYLAQNNHLENRLMILSVNQKCNLKCSYCRGDMDDWYDKLALNSKNADLPKESWDELIRICKQINVEEILLTGGEPLLYKYLHEFTLFLKQNKIKFQIHTNGLSKKGMDYLSFLKQEELYPILNVSSELTNEMQEKIRGGLMPIKFIEEAINLGFKTDIKIVLHQELLPLIDNLSPILHWWKSIGVSSLRFQPVAPIDNLKMENLLLTVEFFPFLDKLIEIMKNDDSLRTFIRHSLESIVGIKSQILQSDFRISLANKCNIINKMVFFNTDLEYLNCKTLWNRLEEDKCDKIFDLLCCGFQQ
jgi:molybdenum cofactor biosynthesis enzyme MoaA